MPSFTNVAVVSFNGRSVTTNRVGGFIPMIPTATKTATPAVYRAGEDMTYIIAMPNPSMYPLENLTVSDNLGATTEAGAPIVPLTYETDSVRLYLGGVLQAPPAVTQTDGVQFTGITVPGNTDMVLVYRARINGTAPLEPGSQITNAAAITGGWLQEPVGATETVDVANAANLTATKALTPDVVPEGGRLTYSFMLENTGNADAESATTTLTDTFDPVLQDIVVTVNGVATTDYAYNPATGEFEIAVDVPAAVYQRAPDGTVTTTPGTAAIAVTGTV